MIYVVCILCVCVFIGLSTHLHRIATAIEAQNKHYAIGKDVVDKEGDAKDG